MGKPRERHVNYVGVDANACFKIKTHATHDTVTHIFNKYTGRADVLHNNFIFCVHIQRDSSFTGMNM